MFQEEIPMLIDEIRTDEGTFQLCHIFSIRDIEDWFHEEYLRIKLRIQVIAGGSVVTVEESTDVDYMIFHWIGILAGSLGYYDLEAYRKDSFNGTQCYNEAKRKVQKWYGTSLYWFPYEIPRGYDHILVLVEIEGTVRRGQYEVRSYTKDGWPEGFGQDTFQEATYWPGKYLIAEHGKDGALKRIFTYIRSNPVEEQQNKMQKA